MRVSQENFWDILHDLKSWKTADFEEKNCDDNNPCVTFTFDNQQVPISLKSQFSDRQSPTLELYLQSHFRPSYEYYQAHVDDATTRQARGGLHTRTSPPRRGNPPFD